MKLWFLPIHIISDKTLKAEREKENKLESKLLYENVVLTQANKQYRERLRRKKILG